MPTYRVRVYKTPPGSNSPSNVDKNITADNQFMALEILKAEVQRLNPKYTVTIGDAKKIKD